MERWDIRRAWPPSPSKAQLHRTRVWVYSQFERLANACQLHVEGDGIRIRRVTLAPGSRADDTDALARVLHAPIVPSFLRALGVRASDLTDGSSQKRLHELLTKRGISQGGLPLPTLSETSEDAIVERAIRSLYDWRATLQFLSELHIDSSGSLSLTKSDPQVIDSFNVHITRGRRPNLIHALLCHLRIPARLSVVLTTNFDRLIEDAFAIHNRPLESISVSSHGALPDPKVVHAMDTVVKLHGSLSETRADFSLDCAPSQEDLTKFFHYVRGHEPGAAETRALPGQLLVAGYSGSDRRCLQMMKTVLERDPAARIYWICHAERAREALRGLFPETSYDGRVVCVSTDRVDLLLYELHQHLSLTLPAGGGGSYNINHNVAPQATFRPAVEELSVQGPESLKIVDEVLAELPSSTAGESSRGKVVVVDGPSGVLRATRGALDLLSRDHGYNKVWLELDDHASAAAVVEDLFEVIAARTGAMHRGHADRYPTGVGRTKPGIDNWHKDLQRLAQYLGIDPQQWVVALYGRNVPGSCAGWQANADAWTEQTYADEFAPLLAGLALCGFVLIYAPYTKTRQKQDERRQGQLASQLKRILVTRDDQAPGAADALARASAQSALPVPMATHCFDDLANLLSKHPTHIAKIRIGSVTIEDRSPAAKPTRFEHTIRTMLDSMLLPELDADRHGLDAPRTLRLSAHRILYGASLMRQSRHYASFLTDGLLRCPVRNNLYGFDNDLSRHRHLEEFLNGLEDRVFLRKPGGFAWQYRDTRLALRCITELTTRIASKPGAPPDRSGPEAEHDRTVVPMHSRESLVRLRVGEWYVRAFFVSTHASPLMEAAFHFYQGILSSAVATPGPNAQQSDLEYREMLWRANLYQLVRTLRHGEGAIRFWFGKGLIRDWFGPAASRICETIVVSWREMFPSRELDQVTRDTLGLLQEQLQRLEGLGEHMAPMYSDLALRGPTADSSRRERSAVPMAPSEEYLDLEGIDWFRRTCEAYEELPPLVEVVAQAESRPSSWARDIDSLRQSWQGDPAEGFFRLQQLVEWTYAFTVRARFREHGVRPAVCEDIRTEPDLQKWLCQDSTCAIRGPSRRWLLTPRAIRADWLRVSFLAGAIVEAAAWLPPGLDVQINYQVSKAQVFYGVALARMGRFHEAHRRLNHAEALLTNRMQPDSLELIGILELRRAEVYALEAFKLNDVRLVVGKRKAGAEVDLYRELETLFQKDGGYGDTEWKAFYEAMAEWLGPYVGKGQVEAKELRARVRRITRAKATDAWNCLERAESLLSGRTQHPLWWGLLRVLQLWVMSIESGEEVGDGPIADRLQAGPGFRRWAIWKDGIAASPNEWLVRVRLLNYFVRASNLDQLRASERDEVLEEWNACYCWTLAQANLKGGPMMTKSHVKNIAHRLLQKSTGAVRTEVGKRLARYLLLQGEAQ